MVGAVKDLGFAVAARQRPNCSDERFVVRYWLRSILGAEGYVQRSGDGGDKQVW